MGVKKMKKALYVLASLIEVLLLTGICAVHYFTKKKMGMARYVVYKNHKWEKAYPIGTLQIAAVIFLAALAVFILLVFIKKRKQAAKLLYAMTLAMVILTGFYIVFTMIKSTETLRDYYFISGMLALAVLIQEIKTIAAIGMCRYEE